MLRDQHKNNNLINKIITKIIL